MCPMDRNPKEGSKKEKGVLKKKEGSTVSAVASIYLGKVCTVQSEIHKVAKDLESHAYSGVYRLW